MTTYRVQPSAYVNNLTDDGYEMTKMPYPFYVDDDGMIQRQDFWQGSVLLLVGFQRDLNENQVDLWWKDAIKDPESAVGMYIVTKDAAFNYATHRTAVSSLEVVE